MMLGAILRLRGKARLIARKVPSRKKTLLKLSVQKVICWTAFFMKFSKKLTINLIGLALNIFALLLN